MPVLFMEELMRNLNADAKKLFKEALKKYKTGECTDIDVFAGEMLKCFFNSTLEIALTKEKGIQKLKEIIKPVENFLTMKRLARDVL